MKFSIDHGPSFAWLRVNLEPGESIQAEAGAMVMRSPQLEMSTRLNAGRGAGIFRKFLAIITAIFRKFFGGEAMFVNEFSGTQRGEVVIAPALSGHVVHRRLGPNDRLLLQAGAYLASTGNIDAKLKWGGIRTLFGGEGLFLLECTGEGDLFINAYGSIVPIEVSGEYIVDTGHIVAFDGSLNFKIKGVSGGLKSLFFSGEGLVVNFSGRGTVYLQSRNVSALVGWISPFLRS
ncbi:MAG: TIGR00266 family protein [Myxococcota bacterium]